MKKRNEFLDNRSHLDALWVCQEHNVMLMADADGKRHCPGCELGVETKPDYVVGGEPDDLEFRNRIDWETIVELAPLHTAYLKQSGKPAPWISVMGWPRHTPMPSGYNEPERYFNVWSYEWGALSKHITECGAAKQTIASLRRIGVKPGVAP